MLRLKLVIESLGIKQNDVAGAIDIGKAAFNLLLNKGIYPKKVDKALIKSWIIDFIEENGATSEQVKTAFMKVPAQRNETKQAVQPHIEINMILKKQVISKTTLDYFKIKSFGNLFSDNDVRSSDDVFSSPDIRYTREAMYQTAKNGGLTAIVGESGSGKSTLRKDLIVRLSEESQKVIVIEPFVLGMEDNDRTGKTLKAAHIAEAIIHAIDPLANPKQSPEARFRQVRDLLLESTQAGNKHCLIIEEAHSLSIPTLKHLKRFYELEQGFTKLISIVLIGQTELKNKLSGTRLSVREVVQRCEMVELLPLDKNVEDYVRFKFKRHNINHESVFHHSAYAAIAKKLTLTDDKGEKYSLIYPLAVNNLIAAAMNLAEESKEDLVTGEVIAEVYSHE